MLMDLDFISKAKFLYTLVCSATKQSTEWSTTTGSTLHWLAFLPGKYVIPLLEECKH